LKRERAEFDILKRIDQERDARGWTDYTLAVNSDLTQSTISTWRSRNLQPNLASIEKICNGLGITLSQFFSESDGNEHLNKDQQHILDLWNRLSPKQREALIKLIEALLDERP